MEIFLGISLLILFILFFGFLIFLKKKRKAGLLTRGMNLVLFLVTVPQVFEKEKEKEVSLEEIFKTAEQFYNSLSGFKEKNKIRKFFFDHPFFVFEIAVPKIGEEIHFYVAAPRSLAQTIEKQILSFWPKAQIQQVPDYNIFNPIGVSLGSLAKFSRSFIFPLRPFQEFGTDPLGNITSVFTKLTKEGEGAALQILIRPTDISLKKTSQKVINALQEGKKIEEIMGEEKSFLKEISQVLFPKSQKEPSLEKKEIPPISQEIISALSKKAAQNLFEVNLRILTSASDFPRAEEILTQLENAFEQFNSPLLNQIKFSRQKGKKLKKLFYRFSFRIFNPQEVLILSSQELASIFHFPSPQLLTPHIKWLKTKQAPAPDNLPQEGLLLGKNIFRGEEKEVKILDDDRRRHFYIVGQTGTGKSALLQQMITQDIEKGKGVALIEPHGDLAEKILGLIPPERAEDVIYFNPTDIERPLGLNMLEYDPQYPESKTFVVNELLEIFEKLYNLKAHGFGGPMFEQYMRNALLLVMEDSTSGSTLIEVPKVLADANFRRHKLSLCQNIVVKNFWELEAEKAGGEAALANMVPYITSKMNIFIANDLMRPIIGQQKSAFNLREIMDEGKILIVNLSKGKLGDINSYLLGMIMVGKILIAALSRTDLPEEERRDFYLYIDEFQNFTTDTITTVLAEARKYRLNMIFAHQYIGQLSEETRKAVFGNVGSMLAFRVGPEDAEYLISQFEPVFNKNDLMNFDNYHGALRLLIRGETSKPFSLTTLPPKKSDIDIAKAIKALSRLQYGKNKKEIETEIYQRLKKSF